MLNKSSNVDRSSIPDPLLAARRGWEGGSRNICMRMRQHVRLKRSRLTSGKRKTLAPVQRAPRKQHANVNNSKKYKMSTDVRCRIYEGVCPPARRNAGAPEAMWSGGGSHFKRALVLSHHFSGRQYLIKLYCMMDTRLLVAIVGRQKYTKVIPRPLALILL
jgi:hypothetical protein